MLRTRSRQKVSDPRLTTEEEKTANAMDIYEQRRMGTTNQISGKRLRAMAPLKKLIRRNAGHEQLDI